MNQATTQIATQKIQESQPSFPLNSKTEASSIMPTLSTGLDAALEKTSPSILERDIQPTYMPMPICLLPSTSLITLEQIQSQETLVFSCNLEVNILLECENLKQYCAQFYTACTEQKRKKKSKEDLFQNITETISKLNDYFNSENDTPSDLQARITKTLKDLIFKHVNLDNTHKLENTHIIYRNPSFMIIRAILHQTSEHLNIIMTTRDQPTNHPLHNILANGHNRQWLIWEKLEIIQLIYDTNRTDGQGRYTDINDTHSVSLLISLLNQNAYKDCSLLIALLCHYGLNIKKIEIEDHSSILHLVITQYKKSIATSQNTIKKTAPNSDTTSKKKSITLNLYQTCEMLLKFLTTTGNKESWEQAYRQLRAYANKDNLTDIVHLIDEATTHLPDTPQKPQNISTRKLDIALNSSLTILEDSKDLRFLIACDQGQVLNAQKIAKTLTNINVGFIQNNHGITTGFMCVLLKLPKNRTRLKPDSEHYFEIAKLLLKDYKEHLDLMLIYGSKQTTTDYLIDLKPDIRITLINLILANNFTVHATRKNAVTYRENVLHSLLWSSFKSQDPITGIIQRILKCKPNLAHLYPYPVPGGNILHQIIFHASQMKSKKNAHSSNPVNILISKIRSILPLITLDILNHCNDKKQDVIAYAENTEHVYPEIIEMLKNKKKEQEKASNDSSSTEPVSAHQSSLTQSKSSRPKKRKQVLPLADVNSDENPSNPSKKQKQDPPLDHLTIPDTISQSSRQNPVKFSSDQHTTQTPLQRDHLNGMDKRDLPLTSDNPDESNKDNALTIVNTYLHCPDFALPPVGYDSTLTGGLVTDIVRSIEAITPDVNPTDLTQPNDQSKYDSDPFQNMSSSS